MKAVSSAIAVLFTVSLALGMVAPAPGAVPSASYDWGTCTRASMYGSTTWFFPNGSTAGGCETEFAVFNDSTTQSASVDFSFMTGTGTSTGPGVTVPPLSARKIIASDYLAGSEFSTRIVSDRPVCAERTTLGPHHAWATSSTGDNWASTEWHFATGSTMYGNETFITVQNPGGSAFAVDVDFVSSSGSQAGPQDVSIPAGSRRVFNLADYITSNSFATKVTSTGGVVCERTVFGNSRNRANDCMGVANIPGSTGTYYHYLAEGATSGDHQTSIQVFNPHAAPVNLNLAYVTPAGAGGSLPDTIAAAGGKTFLLDNYVTADAVSSELAWPGGGGLCESLVSGDSGAWMEGLPGAAAGSTFCCFPGSSTKDGREVLVSLVNAGSADTAYQMTVFFSDGTTQTHSGTAQLHHTVVVDMNGLVGAGRDFSVIVASGGDPLVAEMSSYGNLHYEITASAGMGGSISPSGTVGVSGGEDQAFAITPDFGYRVVDVLVDGVSAGAVPSYTFPNVAADHTISATFAPNSHTWYLAEGSTDWGFEAYISVVNPNEEAVEVRLTYMTSSGEKAGPTVHMPALSQATVFPRDTLGAADFSARVTCEEGRAISADRTMYWTGPGSTVPEAHCATGVTSASDTWYLPEGSSDWGFECFLLIQNPNDTAANCNVTWMIQGGSARENEYAIGANSRATFNMAEAIGAADASIRVVSDVPVICERAMYRYDRREGHGSGGTPTAAADYYLAEGCTGFGFTTWVLVQNPNDTETEVAVTYQTPLGPVEGPVFTMPGRSRQSINVNETTVIPGDDPSFSTHVHGSQPIIAERAMYWNGGADSAQVCHDSIGLAAPHTVWYLADGQTSEGRETWTLVQNPNPEDVPVLVTYLTPDGTGNVARDEMIPANSRRSFNMAEHSGITGRAAVMVTCGFGKKVMVERAMYWNMRGTGTGTVGGYAD